MKTKCTTINKNYGFDIQWTDTQAYLGKLIYLNPGESTDSFLNSKGEKSYYIITGHLTIGIGLKQNMKNIDLNPGESYHVRSGTIYKLIAPNDQSTTTVIIEVGTNFINDTKTI